MRGSTRNIVPDPSRRQSISSVAPTPAVQADSWRSKAGPLPSPSQSKHPVTFIPSQPSALDHVGKLVEGPQEELEVVEFSDMGKFVGSSEDQPRNQDILDGTTPPKDLPTLPRSATWRQNYFSNAQAAPSEHVQASKSEVLLTKDHSTEDVVPQGPNLSASTSKDLTHPTVTASYSGHPKAPRNHKEPGIRALDDAMSRIRGAIDGMQAAEMMKDTPSVNASDSETLASKTNPAQSLVKAIPKERWIPPALRLRNFDREFGETDVTGVDPPRSPKPASEFVVRLPTSSRSLEPVSRKQLHIFTRPPLPARSDILSFDPVNRRDFSFSDSLFGRPLGIHRGKGKYRVSLPRTRAFARTSTSVHTSKTPPGGAFGRPTGADGVTTWRRATPAKPESATEADLENSQTASSSPPEQSKLDYNEQSMASEDSVSQSKSDTSQTRSRIQPKMPTGSSVAFYRESNVDIIAEPKPPVNFIVTSELETNEESTTISSNTATPLPSAEPDSRKNTPSASASKPTEGTPSSTHSKAESKNSDDSVSPAHFLL
jgi:serine/arginine repetitive matrix protein 2